MDDWVGIVVVLAVGVPLLVVAVLVDLRRRRTSEAELSAAPVRGDEAVDTHVPAYVSQEFVDTRTRPGSGATPPPEFSGGVHLELGHLDADFASAGGVADLRDAVILLVNDNVSSIRELLIPLSMAASGKPLVIAATSFHGDVVASLKANRRVAQMPVVAVEANLADLMQLQDQVGGQMISASDLKSGWIPEGTLGSAARWRSDMHATRVLGRPATPGSAQE